MKASANERGNGRWSGDEDEDERDGKSEGPERRDPCGWRAPRKDGGNCVVTFDVKL